LDVFEDMPGVWMAVGLAFAIEDENGKVWIAGGGERCGWRREKFRSDRQEL